jgi:RimJ/RimL family protein N-acetyltransferase
LTTNQKLGPCTLEGKYVRLEPLRKKHLDALAASAAKLDWALMLYPLRSREDVEKRIANGLKAEEDDEEYAFAVALRKDGRIIGSTSYMMVVSRHKRLEIGSTWYVPEMQGTAVNPECKFLLLKHAFEDWGAVRVQLGTHVKNVHSQRAILKLGATFEGRLRNHGIMPDGNARDSLLYSIIASEWPDVKSRLLNRIESFADLDRKQVVQAKS